MGGACSEYGGEVKSVYIGEETCRKKTICHLEGIVVDGRIILKFIFKDSVGVRETD
jgi:hypothetical protein